MRWIATSFSNSIFRETWLLFTTKKTSGVQERHFAVIARGRGAWIKPAPCELVTVNLEGRARRGLNLQQSEKRRITIQIGPETSGRPGQREYSTLDS